MVSSALYNSYNGRDAPRAASVCSPPFADEQSELAFYRALIGSLNEHIYSVRIMSGKEVTVFHNPQCEGISGYSAQDYIADPDLWSAMIHDEDRRLVALHFAELSRVGGSGSIEHRIVRKDGAVRWVANTSVLTHERDDVLRIDGFLLDITERRVRDEESARIIEEAYKAYDLQKRYLAMLAHDIRSPLSGLIGLLTIVANDWKTPLASRHKHLVDRGLQTANNLLEMIAGLVTTASANAVSITPQRRFVLVDLLVLTSIQNQASAAEMKGIRLTHDIPPALTLYADAILIGQALNNLLSNAIKFSPLEGRVHIKATEGDPVTLSVEDHGAGVNPAFANDIFSHAVKTTSHGSTGERGTGMGLPYAADIVRAHGGKLAFVSHPGQGSVFTISLPNGESDQQTSDR